MTYLTMENSNDAGKYLVRLSGKASTTNAFFFNPS